MSYFFHPIARKEHLHNVTYYESKQNGLGARYLIEFETAMKAVCEAPHRYAVEIQPNIRRIRLDKFPFTILYRENKKHVEILAVAHHRLKPGYWVGRL